MRRGLALGLPLLIMVVGGLWLLRPPPPMPAAPTQVVKPTYGDFTLNTSQGPLVLSSLEGKAVVLYFGYTACPDVCPTTMAMVAMAIEQLPEELQEQVTLVMLSVDPQRDELPRLMSYARHFNPSFVAGSASEAEVARIAEDWGVTYRKVETEGSAMGYMIDHTAWAFLIGPDGKRRGVLPHGTPVDVIATRLQTALDG